MHPPTFAAKLMRALPALALTGVLILAGCRTTARHAAATDTNRASMWLDALRGEPMQFEELLDELQRARVIYLGEIHTIPRHHVWQQAILEGLAKRGVPIVLAMEQFEFPAQPALDRFNAGQSDLNQLIIDSDWTKRWRGHTNYHGLMGTARQHGFPVLALNARAETIRAVGRQGLNGLTPEQRAELPAEILTADSTYERLATQVLGVHMGFDPKKLRPIFEAQVARDETMSARLTEFLSSPAGNGRTAVVICGRGHCEFGLGTPDRVARRNPGMAQRIVLFSESGDLQLTEEERRQAREVEITHQFLRELGRSEADFIQLTAPAKAAR